MKLKCAILLLAGLLCVAVSTAPAQDSTNRIPPEIQAGKKSEVPTGPDRPA